LLHSLLTFWRPDGLSVAAAAAPGLAGEIRNQSRLLWNLDVPSAAESADQNSMLTRVNLASWSQETSRENLSIAAIKGFSQAGLSDIGSNGPRAISAALRKTWISRLELPGHPAGDVICVIEILQTAGGQSRRLPEHLRPRRVLIQTSTQAGGDF